MAKNAKKPTENVKKSHNPQIDVLYIVGTGSKFGNEELKYSLRSLETYAKDFGRVFITGFCPPFIDKNKVIYTKEDDIGRPTINHWWKVRQTIQKTEISNTFVLMYDDIFFVKPIELSNYPFYQRGLLYNNNSGGNLYRESVIKASQFLVAEGCTQYNCELHIPCIYDRIKFMELDPIYEKLKKDPIGMVVRSVYANYCSQEDIPEEPRKDIKLRLSTDVVEEMVGDADCFSVSDWVYQCDTQRWLKEHFPNKSRWER